MVKDDIREIKKHYSKIDDLLIVGLGDSRGVNFQKNLLLLLKETLESENYDIKTIDAFSMILNKNRHISSYLKHNISTEQLKEIQKIGAENSIKHVLGDNNFGTLMGVIGSYMVKSANEEKLFISDSIKNSVEPIIIYSSGIDDIMFETQINPYNIRKKYLNNKFDYNTSLFLVKNQKEETLNKITDEQKINIESILGLNENAKICALGAYQYYDNNNYDDAFNQFILYYNEKLKQLCKEYGLIYVGTRSVERTDYRSFSNTYFRKMSYHYASRIIQELGYSLTKNNKKNIDIESFEYNSAGAYGVYRDVQEYREKLKRMNPVKYINSKEEIKREENTLKRVMY